MPQFTGTRDLRSYLRIIWRWKFLLVLIVAAAPVVAYFVEHRKPHIYQSTVLVNVNQASVGAVGSSAVTDNINAIAALVNTTPVADIAGDFLKPAVSGASIVGDVSASPNVTTGFLTITATTESPTRSADIANAFAKALGVNQHQQLVASVRSAIAALRAQANGLPKNSASRAALEQDIQTDQSQLAAVTQGAQILQPATPNFTPVGPHVRQAVELGLLIGLLLGFAVVMVLESADRRMRSPDDLESLTDLPLLAAIAPSAFSGALDTTPVDDEAFQTLRTSLTYFTVDRPLESVLITSPGEKEGKSTVAGRLAIAAAHAGLDVVLIDADLRRAGTTDKFGLRDQPGLGTVLAERRPVETVLVDWPLHEGDLGRLRVLPAGPPPPNPAALISSEPMRALLSSLESQTDLVIIDTPAALAVSDAVPLMQAVSGVVLVARMNQSNRDTIHRLHKTIIAAHGEILGVVATGVTAGPGYEKYSREYYSMSNGNRRGRRKKRKQQAAMAKGVHLSQADPAEQSGDQAASANGTESDRSAKSKKH